jgi:hypothetical protein
MTSGSNLEKVSFPRSVGGFHGVRAYSGVFKAPSYYSQTLHGSGENGARVGSWRGCLVRSLHGGDVFPHGAMRWMS